jgi:branched-chain amino acid transport system permease protein
MFQIIYNFLESFAFIAFAAMGMSIIYGMTGITNMAQGELIMIGAYITDLAVNLLGLPLGIAIACGALFSGVVGLILDRLVVRHLYDRPLDSIVVTWGLSIAISQLTFIIFGSSMKGIAIPFGSFTVAGKSYSYYKLMLIAIALVLIIATFVVFKFTRFGLHSRATMQNREIANSLGVNADRMNAGTFMLGAALAGLCGGLYLPTMALTPNYGDSFLVQSFVTVLVGGADPLIGTVFAGGGLGFVEGILDMRLNTFYGKIGILLIAILFIRILPKGFSGLYNAVQMDIKTRRNKRGGALA